MQVRILSLALDKPNLLWYNGFMSAIIELADETKVVRSQYKNQIFVTIIDPNDEAVKSSTEVTDILLFNILKELKELNK